MHLKRVEVKSEDYLKAASDLYFYENEDECSEYLSKHTSYLMSHNNDELNKVYLYNPKYIFENSPYSGLISFEKWQTTASENLEIILRKSLISHYIYGGYGYILKEKLPIDKKLLTETQSKIWYRVPKTKYISILEEIQNKIAEMEKTGRTYIPYLERS
jgi:hypothetical protein